MSKEEVINYAIEPSVFLKIENKMFGLDKKILLKNSSYFTDLFQRLSNENSEENFFDYCDDTNLTNAAFNVCMMYYYTPSWCNFQITSEHYSIIWQIVYCCCKFGFSKLMNELEKYLIENCNFYFETLKIASHFKLENLRKKCLMFLSTNYITEEKMKGIKDLGVEDLISLIKFQNQYLNKPKNIQSK